MLKSTCGNHPPYFWTWWCEALFLFQLVKGLLFQMPLQRLTVRYSQQQNKYNTKLLSPSSTHKTKHKASSTNHLKHHRITSCCNAFHIFKITNNYSKHTVVTKLHTSSESDSTELNVFISKLDCHEQFCHYTHHASVVLPITLGRASMQQPNWQTPHPCQN